MFRRKFILALAGASYGLLFGVPALAQRGARGGAARAPHGTRAEPGVNQQKTPIDEFETLPPAEQQKALDRLPPAERRKLEERLQRFNALPPQQQQTLKTLYNRLHQLRPERQEAVRKAINRFSQQPADRQQAMRDGLRNVAALPAGQRQTYLNSPEFHSQFSKKEQDILRDMSPLLAER